MAFNSTRYMREYMKQKRADGVYPTNWRQLKKSKKIWYKILHNFFGFNFIFQNQKRGLSTSKTLIIGIALGPIFIKMGYAPSLTKSPYPSKKRLLF